MREGWFFEFIALYAAFIIGVFISYSINPLCLEIFIYLFFASLIAQLYIPNKKNAIIIMKNKIKGFLYDRILGLNGKRTLLSMSINRYTSAIIEKNNNAYFKHSALIKSSSSYYVAGAGIVLIGNRPEASTGDANGYMFSVSWGDNGLSYGGVIDKKEAIRMANHIIENINND